MRFLAKIILLSLFALSCQQNDTYKTENISVAQNQDEIPEKLPLVEDTEIKNIILMIGDGTGLAQISSGQIALVGPDGMLHMQTLPVAGFVKTHSSDNLITDSASGATAYSCGIKTYNGAIAVNPDVEVCKTILELAEEAGLSTGLVATSSITHATPASFAAHVEQRSMEEEIAYDFLDSGVEVFLGGGMEFFSADTRSDSLDLLSEFQNEGYQLLVNDNELNTADNSKLLGLFANGGFERTEGEPSTTMMTKKAIEVLSMNEEGFFLMVEGSQIDWGGHGNDSDYVINEVQDFDDAVKAALDFAQQDGETLVIVTADHETGGMTLQRQTAEGDSLEIFWTSGYHTGVPVPIAAYGPYATEFMGWQDNTEVGQKMSELLGVGSLPIYLEK
ncbi:alkaline phosphatase [Gracilimonas sp.]|uniref:alkaline phosphatase n=1 Tax=Gracilimonas sp. TaxID=1974203 RepID=UPI002872196D|nr:alkaline phosphatase [Gracilimonas sp.]